LPGKKPSGKEKSETHFFTWKLSINKVARHEGANLAKRVKVTGGKVRGSLETRGGIGRKGANRSSWRTYSGGQQHVKDVASSIRKKANKLRKRTLNRKEEYWRRKYILRRVGSREAPFALKYRQTSSSRLQKKEGRGIKGNRQDGSRTQDARTARRGSFLKRNRREPRRE